MFKKSISVLLASLLCLGVVSTANAKNDTGGKKSLETHTSRPQENKTKPAKADGGKPTNTQQRVDKSLSRNSVGKQQKTTKESVTKITKGKK